MAFCPLLYDGNEQVNNRFCGFMGVILLHLYEIRMYFILCNLLSYLFIFVMTKSQRK